MVPVFPFLLPLLREDDDERGDWPKELTLDELDESSLRDFGERWPGSGLLDDGGEDLGWLS
jgi:hypothetical protein